MYRWKLKAVRVKQKFKAKGIIFLVNVFRKRASIIVQDSSGYYTLYTKGADSIIFDRMDSSSGYILETTKNLDDYAKDGLRTLLLAKRSLSSSEFSSWEEEYKAALTSMVYLDFSILIDWQRIKNRRYARKNRN